MEGLEKAINERVSFLKEQINPQNKLLVNRAFEIQIETIRSTNTEGVYSNSKKTEAARNRQRLGDDRTTLHGA